VPDVCAAVFGTGTASGAINLFTWRCIGASSAFSAVCVVMSVSTSSRARFPFRSLSSSSLSPLLHRRPMCDGMRFVALRTVGCLYVCHIIRILVSGLFNDALMSNIEG